MVLHAAADGDLHIAELPSASTDGLQGTLTLLATQGKSQVFFSAAPSSFKALAVRATGDIIVSGNVSTTEGLLSLALLDDPGVQSPAPAIVFHGGVSLSAKSEIVLGQPAEKSRMRMLGPLSLEAAAGVAIYGTLTAEGSPGRQPLCINADVGSLGVGKLVLGEGSSILTQHSPANITAFDIDLGGTIVSGNAPISVSGSKDGQMIGVGAGNDARPRVRSVHKQGGMTYMSIRPVGLHLSDAELGNLRSTKGVAVGSSTTGDIHVVGVSEDSTRSLGMLTLKATGPQAQVQFTTAASNFSEGITVQASNGVKILTDMSTKDTPTTIACGSGTLSVADKASVSTSNQLLTVTTDNIDMQGSALSAGDALIVLSCSTKGRGVGMGSKDPELGQLLLSGSEMQRMHSGGLILGGNCGSMIVAGVKEKHSNNVGTVRLLATSLHKKIIEEETAKYQPDRVVIENPEDIQVAQVEDLGQSTTTALEYVKTPSESLEVKTTNEYVQAHNQQAVQTHEKVFAAQVETAV